MYTTTRQSSALLPKPKQNFKLKDKFVLLEILLYNMLHFIEGKVTAELSVQKSLWLPADLLHCSTMYCLLRFWMDQVMSCHVMS